MSENQYDLGSYRRCLWLCSDHIVAGYVRITILKLTDTDRQGGRRANSRIGRQVGTSKKRESCASKNREVFLLGVVAFCTAKFDAVRVSIIYKIFLRVCHFIRDNT